MRVCFLDFGESKEKRAWKSPFVSLRLNVCGSFTFIVRACCSREINRAARHPHVKHHDSYNMRWRKKEPQLFRSTLSHSMPQDLVSFLRYLSLLRNQLANLIPITSVTIEILGLAIKRQTSTIAEPRDEVLEQECDFYITFISALLKLMQVPYPRHHGFYDSYHSIAWKATGVQPLPFTKFWLTMTVLFFLIEGWTEADAEYRPEGWREKNIWTNRLPECW